VLKIMSRKSSLAGLFFLGAVPLSLGQIQAAEPMPEHLGLTIATYMSGFHLANSHIELIRANGRYELSSKSKTQGFLDNFISFDGGIKAEGVWPDAQLGAVIRPEKVAASSTSSWGEYQSELSFMGEFPVVSIIKEPDDEEERPVVSNEMRRDTVDPLTGAMIGALQGLIAQDSGNSGPCEAKVATFNGRIRGDYEGKNIGPAVLNPEGPAIYGGESYKCEVSFQILAGARKEWLEENAKEPMPAAQVWLADFQGYQLPVRFQLSHSIGYIVSHLVALEIDGETIAVDRSAAKMASN
jgi:hypothetical protein